MMNMIIRILKNTVRKICFRVKLKMIDDIWLFMGGNCFGMFSPSFYYTHTQKEIERITAEEEEKIRKLIRNLQVGEVSE